MRHFFLRNEVGHAVACVASEKREGGDIVFALSVHNPRDPFDKEVAKTIAVNRLEKGLVDIVTAEEIARHKSAKLALLWVLTQGYTTIPHAGKKKDSSLPRRVREAARQRLEMLLPQEGNGTPFHEVA